jgi:hypothetical protein
LKINLKRLTFIEISGTDEKLSFNSIMPWLAESEASSFWKLIIDWFFVVKIS